MFWGKWYYINDISYTLFNKSIPDDRLVKQVQPEASSYQTMMKNENQICYALRDLV